MRTPDIFSTVFTTQAGPTCEYTELNMTRSADAMRRTVRRRALGPGHEGVARDGHGDGLGAALGYVHHERGVGPAPR